MRHSLRFAPTWTAFVLAGVAWLASSGGVQASLLDDGTAFGSAMSALRSAIGEHPRVLRIEVDADRVIIEAQDPHNLNHVDRWQYAVINILRVIPLKRVSGPQAVAPQLVNPHLESNLFDLDAVDLSAMPKLTTAALARAALQDRAAVTYMEIVRQTFILPSPTSGDVRWTVHVDSGREHADIYASAQGVVVGADLSNTRRARTLDLLAESASVADAAAAFRSAVGAGPVLTKVDISGKSVGFITNIHDQAFDNLRLGVPAVTSYAWNLNGLQRRLGDVDTNAMMKVAGPPPFSIDDVNWTIVAQLERDALARVAIPKATVRSIGVTKSSEQPGGPALVWTVEIMEPGGEVTSVIADLQGALKRVVLPLSRRPKVDWLDAATIAGALASIAPTFGSDAKIASIVFEDREGRITIDDRDNGGQPATFEFSSDGVKRANITFQLDSTGPRFAAAEVAPLNEQMIAMLEAQAMQRLAAGRKAYLESVTIGPNLFVRQAGARAIEVQLRDLAEDSARAHYARIVFDFNGRVLDLVTF